MDLVTANKNQLDILLKNITNILDITQYQYEEAEKRYQAVGKFLSGCPKISPYNPKIFPQGSFRLGTVVRPIKEGEEYDIDLVCLLNATHSEFTQKGLKNLIGDRLKEPQYKNLLEPENRRSWTLKYNEDSKFHLDILPVIPDSKSVRILTELKLDTDYYSTAISITDNQTNEYASYSMDWPKSNPKGYTEWFKNQMKVKLNESRSNYALSKGINIDDVPFYRIKTPLQRAIQILKRHRDLLLGDDDDKPISIIITTLSARAYGNEDGVYEALMMILNNMELYIIKDEDGNDKIVNPVDPRENFADKWVEYPERRVKFYAWLERARMDFETLLDKSDFNVLRKSLNESLGEDIISKSIDASLLPNVTEKRLTTRNKNAIDYSPNEEFIEDQFPVNLLYNLKINCKVDQAGFRTKLLKDILTDVYILKRNHSLKFFIEYNAVPGPYIVKWKVRNCGSKAKARGVRGQILDDDGSEARRENSSFFGSHFVECYIIKESVCVARARIDVPISGILN